MTGLAVTSAMAAVLLVLRPPPARPPPEPGTWMSRGVLLLAAGGAVLVIGPLLVVPLLVALGGRELWRLRRRRRSAEATADRVVESCELLAAEVSAGQPPGHALAHAADAWHLLAPAAEAGVLGGDVPRTLRELAARPGASDLRLVGAAWDVAHRSGSGLADALDRVAASVRADRATRRVVESELASARATARLVAALPVLVLLLGAGAGAETSPWGFLVGSPLGLACLVGGLSLGLLGLWWIERIAAGVVG